MLGRIAIDMWELGFNEKWALSSQIVQATINITGWRQSTLLQSELLSINPYSQVTPTWTIISLIFCNQVSVSCKQQNPILWDGTHSSWERGEMVGGRPLMERQECLSCILLLVGKKKFPFNWTSHGKDVVQVCYNVACGLKSMCHRVRDCPAPCPLGSTY